MGSAVIRASWHFSLYLNFFGALQTTVWCFYTITCTLNFILTCQAIRSFSFSIFSRSSGCSCMYLSLKKAWRRGRKDTVFSVTRGKYGSNNMECGDICDIYKKKKKREKWGSKKTNESTGTHREGLLRWEKCSQDIRLPSTTCTISQRWRSDPRAKNSRRSSSDSYYTASPD